MKRISATRVKKGCNRCGSKDVAWQQSERGKWYLSEVFDDPRDGGAISSSLDFHSNYCNKPGEHEKMQQQLNDEYAEDQRASEEERRELETKRIEVEAKKMRDFIELSPSEREAFIEKLEKKYSDEARDPVSMDYLVEHIRYCTMMEGLRSEIDFYEDLLADLEGGE